MTPECPRSGIPCPIWGLSPEGLIPHCITQRLGQVCVGARVRNAVREIRAMRIRRRRSVVTVHPIGGQHAVILGMDATRGARRRLLGVAVHRTDHTEDEAYWLGGFKTFRSAEPRPLPGELLPTSIQSRLFCGLITRRNRTTGIRTGQLRCMGPLAHWTHGPRVVLDVETESAAGGRRAVFFKAVGHTAGQGKANSY